MPPSNPMEALLRNALGGGGPHGPSNRDSWKSSVEKDMFALVDRVVNPTPIEVGTIVLISMFSERNGFGSVGIVIDHVDYDIVEKNTGSPYYNMDHTQVVALMTEPEGQYEHNTPDLELVVLPPQSLVPILEKDLSPRQETEIAELRNKLDLLNKSYDFKPGTVVTWKEGLQNRKQTGEFIFAGYIKDPKHIIATRENLDRRVETTPLDGDLIDCHVIVRMGGSKPRTMIYGIDSRRIEPVEGTTL